ncbi:hypothetical protein OAP63_04615, partial [Vibrio sp.]|nr:hypothetical protein [Vibrio sp.]
EYVQSTLILKIVVWKLMFAYFGALFSRVLIIKGWSQIELIKTVIASALSLSLSIVFIQIYGLVAVAIVSVLSYVVADLLSYLLFKNTRIFFFVVVEELFFLIKNPIKSVKKCFSFILNKKAIHAD